MSTFSKEHRDYLKKIRNQKIIVFIFRILIISIFLVGWELLSKYHIINTFLSSSPSNAIKTTIDLFRDGVLLKHIGITLYEVLVSFVIATIIGLVVATILWSNKTISKIIDPYLTILKHLL